MPEALIEDLDQHRALQVRINGANPTFTLRTERIAASAVAPLDPMIEDLLDIAAAIFAADGAISRGSPARPDMGAEWRRNLRITCQVRNPDRWSDPDVVSALSDVVEFLTEDRIDLRFVPMGDQPPAQQFLDLDPTTASFRAEEAILFSGGLDSFAGALEALSTSNHNVLLVSHRSAQKVMPRQDRLAAYLEKRFPKRFRHIKVTARRVGPEAKETTQRSRSLLFAALGQAVAMAFGASRVSFYENGIVSHNLPISPQVVGTMATRTTHPLGLKKLHDLMQLVIPGAVPLSNPYEWLTKTEVVQRIAQHGGESQIREAVSCTNVRDQTKLNTHCGICSQCLDRRFGILAAGLGDQDPPETYKTDVILGERSSEASIKMAVEWTRHALRLESLDAAGFLSAFGLEVSRIVQASPGQSPLYVFDRVQALHRRHAHSAVKVLQASIQTNSAALADGSLPASSLLRLHIGSSGADRALPPDPRAASPSITVPRYIPDDDLRPDPTSPLEVAFFADPTGPVVAVTGLCRIDGAAARVPHALKPFFDQDRAAGRDATEHRFILYHEFPGPPLSKPATRKYVSRCRSQLREAYIDLYGVPPSEPLLIQSRLKDGYRLDPTIRLTSRKQ